MPKKHSILGPSSAKRWMSCPPSVRLTEKMPDTTSPWAAEGTLAHNVAELKVKKKFTDPMGEQTFKRRLKKLGETKLFDESGKERNPKEYWPETLSATDDYLDYITGVVMSYPKRPHVSVEVELNFDRYAKGGFGTCDCLVLGGSELHIIDFKFGKGVPVSAENNPQMMLYALGALELYGALYDIHDIVLTIFQPRADGDTVKEWSISRNDLVDWGVFTVRPLAEKAFAGEGEFRGGDWCRFCRAKNTCRARADQYTALEDFGAPNSKTKTGKLPVPPLLSDAEVGGVLEKAIALEKWVADLKDYAITSCLAGKEIPGWKAVEGRKTRVWDDPDAAFADITTAGIEEAMLYERKPLTLAGIEKMLGKARFTEVAGAHVTVSSGKPALAPVSDKRDAITNKPSAEEDFK
ncbi:DUF2800 domain-containing protein [Clostridium merdae]|uniref:DUF2800 domain-containing protein n=1 Tax=Clostridium merdae TaxID=1958780 RepID=UPI000A267E9C|nr:DUF2800 domain-containing protein [Clostridium merdae]